MTTTVNPEAKLITSPANQAVKDVRALEMRKKRKETGLFIAEGMRTCIEGMELGAGMTQIFYLTDLKDRPDIVRLRDYCHGNGGEAFEVSRAVLEKIAQKENPQSVIGVFKQKLQALKNVPLNDKCWVVLEEVRDPGNLGTIIRTIDSVGASGVILVESCCDPYSFEGVRATMGSIFHVPIVTTPRSDFIAWAKKWPGKIIGTTLQDSTDYREADYKAPVLLLMGNEQAGLTDELRAVCTTRVRIPMNGRADSLNLSVATGIMLYKMLEN